jgi:hypothetical protein
LNKKLDLGGYNNDLSIKHREKYLYIFGFYSLLSDTVGVGKLRGSTVKVFSSLIDFLFASKI